MCWRWARTAVPLRMPLPRKVKTGAFRPFTRFASKPRVSLVRRMLRKTLRQGGAVRIDHVMMLFRLFWVPRGLTAAAGAYVQYPADDLLRLLALESTRAQTLVIGEDLGTVPDYVREQFAAYRILSYRVFYFERNWEEGSFKPPATYPEQSWPSSPPTIYPRCPATGKERIFAYERVWACIPTKRPTCRLVKQRARDKEHMLAALRKAGLWPRAEGDQLDSIPVMTPELCRADSYVPRHLPGLDCHGQS